MGRKRKRQEAIGNDKDCDLEENLKTTIRNIVGKDPLVLTLAEFLGRFVSEGPEYIRNDGSLSPIDCYHLENMLLIPSGRAKALSSKDFARNQSLHSLIDDVIWTLVQRRDKEKLTPWKQRRLQNTNESNLLCQGYVVGEPHTSTASASHFPLVLTRLNSNVDFLKSSAIFRLLHLRLGDDVLRTMLLDCSTFVPLVSEEEPRDKKDWNWMQISGPPVSPFRPPKHLLDHTQTLPRMLRRSLLFSDCYMPHVGFGRNHVLQSGSAYRLLNSLLGEITGDSYDAIPFQNAGLERWSVLVKKKLSEDAPVFAELLDLSQEILKSHNKTDYHRLLDRYCPLHEPLMDPSNSDVNLLAKIATNGFTPQTRVTSWIRTICSRALKPLWNAIGKPNEECVFDTLIPMYVNLRRDEHIANKTIMNGLKLSKCSVVSKVASFTTLCGRHDGKDKASSGDHERAKLVLLSMLRWVFSTFLSSIIKSAFYMTTTEFSGKDIYFYRRPLWTKFRSLALKKLGTKQYQEVTAHETLRRVSRLGLSSLRLLPKETGVRPIATLCKQEAKSIIKTVGKDSSKKTEANWSTNTVLSDTFAVLSFEHERKHDSFGCGLAGLHYFYPKYREFLIRRGQQNPRCALYFGSVDIAHCFDSIEQDYLIDLIRSILCESEYMVQKHQSLNASKSAGRIIKKTKKEGQLLQEYSSMYSTAVEKTKQSKQQVLVGGVLCSSSRSHDILSLLAHHVRNHVVVAKGRFGQRFLSQTTGIPQGSVLSTLLCNFYFGRLEEDMFDLNIESPFEPCDLLARMVDDFVFVSHKKPQVERFMQLVQRGVPDLGVQINQRKTKLSLNVVAGDTQSGQEDQHLFPWCGMLFDCHTGETRIDYSRLVKRELLESFTIERAVEEGSHLLVQMKSFIHPRCIPILFDSKINSKKLQHLNMFQLMLYAAMKTWKLIKQSTLHTGKALVQQNIPSLSEFAIALIQNRMRAIGVPRATTALTRVEVQKLTHVAFSDVFQGNMMKEEPEVGCQWLKRKSKVLFEAQSRS